MNDVLQDMSNSEANLVRHDPGRDAQTARTRAMEAARRLAKEAKLAERRSTRAAKAAAKMKTCRGAIRKCKLKNRKSETKDARLIEDMPAEAAAPSGKKLDFIEDVRKVCSELKELDDSQ